ncbi:hypothetical protein AJ87_39580 [Rhizobium yanglingense]|nr:hypothetical protein AJ87_39580 [Rhizobium yanglingense]
MMAFLQPIIGKQEACTRPRLFGDEAIADALDNGYTCWPGRVDGRPSLPRGHDGRHAGFETSRQECLARDHSGNGSVEGTPASLHRAFMALSVAQWPFVFEKIQRVVSACEGPLQTALQPNPYRPVHGTSLSGIFSSFHATNDPDEMILGVVSDCSRP